MTFDLFDLALCPKCQGRGKIGMSIWKTGRLQLHSVTCTQCRGVGKLRDRLDDIQDRYVLNPDLDVLAQHGAEDVYWLTDQVIHLRDQQRRLTQALQILRETCKKCRKTPEAPCERCQTIDGALGKPPSSFGAPE